MVAQIEAAPVDEKGSHLPGDINIWIFVLADLFSFGFYFVTFMVYRVEHGDVFRFFNRIYLFTESLVAMTKVEAALPT